MRPYPRRLRVGAVVLAAGRGSRLTPGGAPKQYLPLGGRPLVTHALETYQQLSDVDGIALVIPPGDDALGRALAASFPKVRWVVPGGPTRCESSRAGVLALDTCDVVVIQNAVSPFTPAELIERCAREAWLAGAAAGAAKSPYASIETAGLDGAGCTLTAIHDRAVTWSLRDPQAFGYEALRVVHARAATEGALAGAIDEVHLFTRYGKSVSVVEGPEDNLRITVAADLERAHALVRSAAAGRSRPLRRAPREQGVSW